MKREIINPWTWLDQFGFVQANAVADGNRVIYCAGQTSVDDDGNPARNGDMAGQLDQALDNLETVLGQAGATLADVVRLNYYVTDLEAFFRARRPSRRGSLRRTAARPRRSSSSPASRFPS